MEINMKKKFESFIIELKIQSIEEARLLYHLFNHSNLKKLILNDKNYMDSLNINDLSEEIATCIDPENDDLVEDYIDFLNKQRIYL